MDLSCPTISHDYISNLTLFCIIFASFPYSLRLEERDNLLVDMKLLCVLRFNDPVAQQVFQGIGFLHDVAVQCSATWYAVYRHGQPEDWRKLTS